MTSEQTALDALVAAFATDWLRLEELQIALRVVADPILVLSADGAVPVPRQGFLAAITARSAAVDEAGESITTLSSATAQPLGDRMVLATISWIFTRGDSSITLVSDFLLQREGPHGLRCVAYLPRTNVLDHVD